MLKEDAVYILCIESSKTRGMGHLFRSLLYASYLKSKNREFIILINHDENSIAILKSKNLPYEIVDFSDESDWESAMIKKYHATVWLEDKFETPNRMAENIKKNKEVLFCCIDDFSDSAMLADISFAGMLYLTGNTVRGKKIYSGPEYVILNPEINQYRRERTKVENVIVSLGGSDPFGATVEVVEALQHTVYNVAIIIGPNFDYKDELDKVNVKGFPVKQYVPSLIEEFSKFDFAITGGGGTCCEANAMGLPCMIIANAPHEVYTGKHMQQLGGCIYAGLHGDWNRILISELQQLDIQKMSSTGIKIFDTDAIKRIFTIIEERKENGYEG